jgi:ketosteroid isomerase-like protein
MSRENGAIMRRSSAAFNRGDREAAFAALHPDVEWFDLHHAQDAPERLHGLAAVRAYVEQWYDASEDFRLAGAFKSLGVRVIAQTCA